MTSYAAYLVPRPVRDILMFDQHSADAAFFALSRVTLAGMVVFASIPTRRLTPAAHRNMLICAGVCLSLPATVLSTSMVGMLAGVYHLTRDVAHRNLLKGAGFLAASYIGLEFHDRFKWGLCEPLLRSGIAKRIADSGIVQFFQGIIPSPIRKGFSHISAVVSWNLPPQPLKDLNPFNVRTQEDAERVVLTAQRIAFGALIASVGIRYTPIKRTPLNSLISLGSIVGCLSLSLPAALIGGSVFFSVRLVERVMRKDWIFSLIALVGTYAAFEMMPCYNKEVASNPFMPRWFNRIFLSFPNVLDHLFVQGAKRCSGVAFRLLARKNNQNSAD